MNTPPAEASAADPSNPERQVTLPTGVGRYAGDPSPDDRAAVLGGSARVERDEGEDGEECADTAADDASDETPRRSTGQTRVYDFE